jgi:hypothetical protein
MENEINITNARYVVDPINDVNEAVIATIDGQEMSVPLDPANRHYAEILKQVEAGTLTIAAAE